MPKDKNSGKKLADMMYGGDQIRATPQGRISGPIANAVRKAQQFAGQYEVDPRIPLLGGMSVDELLSLPDAASLLEDVSYNGMGALVRGGNAATGGIGTFRPDERIFSAVDLGATATGLGSVGLKAAKAAPKAVKRAALDFADSTSPVYVHRPTTPKKPDPDVGTRYKKQFVGNLAPRKDLNIEDLENSSVKIFPHDATSRGYAVTEVSDVPLTKSVLTEGGDDYMRDLQHMQQRIATASNPGIAKRIQKRTDQAAIENQLLGGTGKVYGFPVRMGEGAERASTFPTDIAMDLLMQGGLSKKEMAALTDDLRTMAFEGKGRGYFKDVAPIGSPEFLEQLREGVKANKETGTTAITDMNLRKGLMDRLALVENQKRLGFNIQDLTNAVLADELKGVPKGYVGNVAAELDPFTLTRPSQSSTYGVDIGGLYEGSMPNMPVEFLTPNTFEDLYREMKTLYPTAKPEALRNMAIGAMEKRNENISEMIGPRSVDAVKTFQEGLKQGEFDPNNITEVYDFMRRKKLGLELAKGGSVQFSGNPDVMQLELNKGRAVRKAAGGGITGDDLILEERPL
jgi:hypothetical protein